jgi:hypothetical protein
MIDRLTLLAWLAAADPTHTDAFADLIGDGLLTVENDRDEIVGLTITAQGRATLGPPLPWTTA